MVTLKDKNCICRLNTAAILALQNTKYFETKHILHKVQDSILSVILITSRLIILLSGLSFIFFQTYFGKYIKSLSF